MTGSRSELERTLQMVQHGQLAGRALYKAVHAWGRENFMDARPEVERLLADEDPEIRSIALEVLTRHWRVESHWKTAKEFAFSDPDADCRLMGISALETLKRNTQDRTTLRVLAQIVLNEQEKQVIREAAYGAMIGVRDFDPARQLTIAARGLNLMQDVDWAMVRSYEDG